MFNKSTFVIKLILEKAPCVLYRVPLLTFLLSVTFALAQQQQQQQQVSLPSNLTSWTVPCGVTAITVQAWGGGGGGGYRNVTNSSGAPGGGGSAYAKMTIDVTATPTITYSIGKGGVGTTDGTANSNGSSTQRNWKDVKNGKSTTLSSIGWNLTVDGGKGALDNTADNTSSIPGNLSGRGAGGKASNNPNIPKITSWAAYDGGNGGNAAGGTLSGGGGGAGFPGGVGQPGNVLPTDNGGLSSPGDNFGGRGAHGVSRGNGQVGVAFGGGGSGGYRRTDRPTTGPVDGGAGADGGIIITYTLPKIQPTTSSTTFCQGSSINIQHSAIGVSSITSTGLPGGVTATYASNIITISGTPAAGQSGVFNYEITPNGCATYKLVGTITINTSSVGGTVNSAQTICTGTSPAPLTLSGQNGAVVRWQKATNPAFTSALNLNYTSTTLTSENIGNLTANTYFRAVVQNGNCAIVNSNPVLITVGLGTDTTFTGGTTWSNGVPDINKKAIFAADYDTTDGNITACSCEIQSQAKLTIGANSNATIQNNIVNSGLLTIESEGNLIQINNNGTYTGNIATVKRDSRMKRLDYIYWGTPVTGQTLRTFSPNTVASRFYSYNESDDSFSVITPLTQEMVKGKGYVIRAPNNFTTLATWLAVFTGKPNNGIVQVPVTKNVLGKNLVGNPYPSNIDLDKLTANNYITSTGVYYFWTNTNDWDNSNGTTPNGQFGDYVENNYAIYTLSGGTPAANSSIMPSGIIKPGQGFLYEAGVESTLFFSNEVRTASTIDKWGETSTFISNKGGMEAPNAERYWLKLTNPAGNFNTLLLAYVEGATNSFESKFDAKFPVQSSDRFYSISDNTNLIVQGRQYPFVSDDSVTLGLHNYETGIYNIALSKKEGIFNNGQDIYLKDKQTGTVTNLSQASYSFTANEGVSDTRFEIIYKPETVLVTDNTIKDELQVYRDGTEFIIKSQSKKITELEVYDTAGRLILKTYPNQPETRVDGRYISNGMYILKINRNGEITTKKILK